MYVFFFNVLHLYMNTTYAYASIHVQNNHRVRHRTLHFTLCASDSGIIPFITRN